MIAIRRMLAAQMSLVWSATFAICLVTGAYAEHSPSPSDVMKTDSVTDKHGFQSDDDKQRAEDHGKATAGSGESKTVRGALSRVESGSYFVKPKDGNELQLHADKSTKMVGKVSKGDQVEATVNANNHMLSIRTIK